MKGTEIREHITTLASATPHPSLSSDSGHQGDEWLRLIGNSPGESRAKKAWPGLGSTALGAEKTGAGRGGARRWYGGGHGGKRSWKRGGGGARIIVTANIYCTLYAGYCAKHV